MRTIYRNFALLLLVLTLPRISNSQTGAALNFDGTNDYVQMPSFSFGSNWSVETWINPATVSGGWYAIAGQAHYNNLQGFVIAINNGTVFADGPQGLHIETSIVASAWTHVALTYNSGVFAFYKNGILAGTQQASFTPATNNFLLGSRYNNNGVGTRDPFNGSIDEVRVWSVTRSQCDILSYMNCEIPNNFSGLTANYHFNQGTANGLNTLITSVTDATSNGNSGSLVNFGLLLLSASSNFVAPGPFTSGFSTPTMPSPEINLAANGQNINDNSTSTNTNNYTDFNGTSSRAYIIQNTGSSTLNVGTPYLTGADASQFSVTAIPASILAASTGTTSFSISFNPTSAGTKTAIVNIYNSDCNEEVYNFVIAATATLAASLSFDGSNDYLETNANLVELGQNDFTIEAWIKTTSNDFGIVTVQNSNTLWEPGEKNFLVENDGHLSFVGHGCDFIQANTDVSVTDGAWHHVAVVWDLQSGVNGVGKIYVDGIDRTASSTYSANTSNIGTFRIGTPNYGESQNFYQGQLDEVRIWNVARTQCQIQTFMNCEIPTSSSGLVANYHFNQGSITGTNSAVTTATNAAGSTNATLTNFALTGTVSNWVIGSPFASGYTISASPGASISVSGGGNNISAGSSTTSTLNLTDFGGNSSRTFSITNTGTGVLYINSVTISGGAASDFTLTGAPAGSLAASASTSFTVRFNPASVGTKSEMVIINSSDCSVPDFSFALTATAVTAAAINLDGNDDYAIGPLLSTSTNSITLQARVNWAGPTATSQVIAYNGNTSLSGYGFFVAAGTNIVSILYGSINSTSVCTLPAGAWTSLSMVLLNNVASFYRDGILTATVNMGNPVTPSGNFMIGGNNTGGETFNGSIDEGLFWNSARTQCQILTYQNAEVSGATAGLRGAYHFNQAVAAGNNLSNTTVSDASGLNNNLTLNGLALSGTTSNWVFPGALTSGFTTSTAPLASLGVQGNGSAISNGAVSTSTTDFTDFSSATTRTFVLQNSGTSSLYINNITLSGAGSSQFSIIASPSSTVGAAGSSSLVIQFIPTSAGTKTVQVTVSSSDCSVPLYSFVLSATCNTANALAFDGVDDFIETNNNITELGRGDFTIEAWIRTTGTSLGVVTVANNNTTWDPGEKCLYIDGSGIPTFVGYSNGYIPGNIPVNDNNWHHVAVSWNHSGNGSGTGKMFIDGVDHTGGVSYFANLNNSGTFKIGKPNFFSSEAPNYFSGQLDEVRIWSRSLCLPEIAANMNCQITSTVNGLQANYHFNSGLAGGINTTVTSLADASGNNINGTLNSFALTGTQSNWMTPGAVNSTLSCSSFLLPEMEIRGNGILLANQDFTAAIADGTDFGPVCSGQIATQVFSISNSGSSALVVNNIFITGIGGPFFTLGAAGPFTISPASSQTFALSFASAGSGVQNAFLNFSSSDCDDATFAVSITGSAIALPSLTVSSSPTVLCAGNTASLNISGATSYTWNTGSNASNILVSPLVSTNYSVTGTSAAGCTNSAVQSVSVNALPVLAISATSTVICLNETSTLTASGATTYSWSSGPNTANFSVSPVSTQNYTVVGTDAATGCSNTSIQSVSVNPLPSLTISATSTVFCSGGNSTLTASGAASYSWTAGPLNSTYVVNPASNTDFTVTGTSAAGCTNIAVQSISVNANPTVTITYPSTIICVGQNASLTANGATSYVWSDASTSNSISVSPGSTSNYSVIGTAAGGCTNSAVQSVSVNALPVLTISATSTVICQNETSTLTAFGASSYSWSAGPNTANFAVSPTSSQNYTVEGTDAATGCSNMAVQSISVNPLPSLTISATSTVFCSGGSSTLTASGASSYSWTAGPLNNTYVVNPTSNADFTVTGTSAAGCTNTAIQSISVNPNPTLTITYPSTIICVGQTASLTANGATSYVWSDASTNNSILINPGTFTSYSVVGTAAGGCTNSAVQSVSVNALPVLTISSTSTIICQNETSTLTVSGASSYSWSAGPNTANFAVSPTSSQNYTVDGTDVATGCSNTAVQSISVNPLPSLSITPTSSVLCAGSSGTLTASGASSYTWTSGPVNSVFPVTAISNANHTVTGTSSAGCTNTAVQNILVNPNPTISITTNSSICLGQTATITASGASSYSWSNSSTSNSIIVGPTVMTVYNVTGFTSAGCSATGAYSIIVNPVPSVFISASSTVICQNQSATLTASGASSFTWIGGPTTASNNVSPLSTNNYTVIGSNATTGCTNMAVESISVNPLPVLTISPTSTVFCSGGSSTLTASGAASYSWSGGPVNSTYVVSPTANADFTVTGTSAAGCTNTAVQSISVNANPAVTITYPSSIICVGQSASLTANGATSYVWSNASTNNSISVSPGSSTSYSVIGTIAGGCTNSAVQSVSVNALPSVSITANSTVICLNQSATLTASGASNYSWISGPTNASFVVSPLSTQNFTVTGTDATTGCTNTAIQSISVNPLPSLTIAATSTVFCSGGSSTLTASGAASYSWTSGPVNNVYAVNPTSSSNFTVTGTSVSGCTNNAVQSISVIPLPAVSITAPSTIICAGQNASLTANGASSYLWSTASTNNSISVNPTSTSSYSVTGTAAGGCTNSAIQSVSVNALPNLSITASGTVICLNETSTLSASGASTYSWAAGPNTASYTVSPASTQNYTVTGTDLSTNCTNTAVQTISVNPLPSLTITASSTVFCSGGSSTLTASGASSYSWNSGPSTNSFAVSPTANTNYTVTGTSAAGCTNSAVQSISVNPNPTVTITSPSTIICVGQNASLTANGGNSYLWSNGSTNNSISVSPATTTNYTVTGTAAGGCTNIAIQTVSVNSLPTLSINASSTLVCAGETVSLAGAGASSYTWSGGISDGVAFSATSTASYSLDGTNAAGCNNTLSPVVTVSVLALPVLSITPSASLLCSGDSLALNASGASTYSWSNGVPNNQYFKAVNGVLTVTGTAADGCRSTEQFTVVVNSRPILTLSPTATLTCMGESVQVTANGADTYSWSTGSTSSLSLVSPTATSVYSVTGTSSLGCSSALSYTQIVSPCSNTIEVLPVLNAAACRGKKDGSIQLNLSNTYSNSVSHLQWMPAVACSTCESADSLAAGNYSVKIVVNYTLNGIARKDSILVQNLLVDDGKEECRIRVHNGLTLNNDGVNDNLQIENITEFPNNSVSIFNRWGALIYNGSGYDNRSRVWPESGSNAKPLPGTYFYIIDLGDGSKPAKGWIEVANGQ